MAVIAAGSVALVVVVVVGLRRVGLVRVQVQGGSMRPTLEPGDRLLVRRRGTLRPGDIVSLQDPRDPSLTLVKRIHTLGAAGVDVRGDNPEGSTDSRTFGPVPLVAVTGTAVYRYHPPGRAGRTRR